MIKTLFVMLALTAGSAAAEKPYDKPESCHWDAQSKHWYISNVGGSPVEKDGKGWLSKLDAGGKIVTARWVSGLNAPKGMRVHGGNLYVADIDQLRIIDIKEGKLVKSVPYEGAQFLNDVAVDGGGTVYVSDMFTGKIHTYKDGKPGVFVEGEATEHPNGIVVDGDKLVIAAWGPGLDPMTFATTSPGRVLTVDLQTKAIAPLGSGARVGNLDGIEKWGSGYLATDYMTGKLHLISADGSSKVFREGFTNGADIGLDSARRLLAVPEMGADKITFIDLSK